MQVIQIKPYSFLNDDKYNTISPSLRIDIFPKKNLTKYTHSQFCIYNAIHNQMFSFKNGV